MSETGETPGFEVPSSRFSEHRRPNFEFRTSDRTFLEYLALHAAGACLLTDLFSILARQPLPANQPCRPRHATAKTAQQDDVVGQNPSRTDCVVERDRQ